MVTDKNEAPSADDATFAVDENSPSGSFVGNYGSPSYVTLGDSELIFDIVNGNSARKAYTYTNLDIDANTGAATMTLDTASATGETIQNGDKIQIRDDSTLKTLIPFADGGYIEPAQDQNNMIQLRVASAAGWQEGDTIYIEMSGCTDVATKRLLDGPKKIQSMNAGIVGTIQIKSFGLEENQECTGGKVWMMVPNAGNNPNGIFTVINSQSTTIEFSAGLESKHGGTWASGGTVIVLGKEREKKNILWLVFFSFNFFTDIPFCFFPCFLLSIFLPFIVGFNIEDCSGIITIASDAMNYEYTRPQTFSLEVQVRTEQTINTATVTITVNNVDEAPYLVLLPTDATADECLGSSCSGGASHNIRLDGNGNTFMVEDPEGQSDFTLTVLDDAGNRNGAGLKTWMIDNSAPRTLTRISSAVLDYETKSSYVLQVVAIDNDDPINLRIQFTLTITLNQINEPPTFDPVYFSISEAATSGTDLQPSALSVFDPENDATTLIIDWPMSVTATNLLANNVGTMASGDRPFKWKSDGTTDGDPNAASTSKILQVGTDLDHETIQQYVIVMKACDVSNLCTVSPYTSIQISITDVNEKPAWKAGSYVYYVNENDNEGVVMNSASGGTAVGSLALQIDDPDLTSTHTFSILPDTDGSGVGLGGWLTTQVLLTSELGKPLRINVAAAKSTGSEPNYELPPLQIINGGTPATGSPTNPAAYKFNIKVTDNGGLAADATQQIEIRIVDSNEPPTFSTATRNIDENSLVGAKTCAEITCGEATPDTEYFIIDDDIVSGSSGQTATLSIVSGNIGNAFELSATTGVTEFFEVQVQTSILNYEGGVGTSYFLGIQITDVGGTSGGITDGLTTTGIIEIKIVDINDAPILSAQSVSILKTAVEGDCVTPSTFSGDDEDLPQQTLTYALTAPISGVYSDGVFVARGVTGGRQGEMCIENGGLAGSSNQLESSLYKQAGGVASSDYNSGTNTGCVNCVYTFTLTVTDNGTPVLSTPAVLTLSIGDVNAVPTFTPSSVCTVPRSLPENTLAGTVFGASIVTADPDDNDQITMTMVNNADGKFGIVTPTVRTGSGAGSWSFSTQIKPIMLLDFEAGTNEYIVRIRASDNKQVPSVIECDVTITLTNVNEAPGSVGLYNDPLTVEENANIHFKIGSVLATDPDRWQDLNWNLPIIGNLNPNPFYITPRTEILSNVNGAVGTFSTGRDLDILSPSNHPWPVTGNPDVLNSIPTMLSAISDNDHSTFIQETTGTSTLQLQLLKLIRPQSVRITMSGDPWKGGAFTLKMDHRTDESGNKKGGCDFDLVPPVIGTTTPSHWTLSTAPKEFVLTGCSKDTTLDEDTEFNLQISSPNTLCPTTESDCQLWCESRNMGPGAGYVASSFASHPAGCTQKKSTNSPQCRWNTNAGTEEFSYLSERCNPLRIHEVSLLTQAKAADILVSGYAPINYEALSSSSYTINVLVEVSDVGGTETDGLTSSGIVVVAVTDQAEPPFDGGEGTLTIAENTVSNANSLHQLGNVLEPGDPDATGTASHSFALFRPGGLSSTSSCWKMTANTPSQISNPFVTPIPATFGTPPLCKFDAVVGIDSIQNFGIEIITDRNLVPEKRLMMWQFENNEITVQVGTSPLWTGTQALNNGDLISSGILTSASCKWKNKACGDKTSWTPIQNVSE